MKLKTKIIFGGVIISAIMLLSCARKNPPRDEIPILKDVLAKFEQAVKAQSAAQIDSLMIAEALELGYNSGRILSEIYPDTGQGTFYTFGKRNFFYTKDKAVVNCLIMADSLDIGRPVEITLVKTGKSWLIKRFDLK